MRKFPAQGHDPSTREADKKKKKFQTKINRENCWVIPS